MMDLFASQIDQLAHVFLMAGSNCFDVIGGQSSTPGFGARTSKRGRIRNRFSLPCSAAILLKASFSKAFRAVMVGVGQRRRHESS
jgi:hypothetical protein